MIKLNFCVKEEFLKGINRLQSILDFEIGDGITVNAVESDKNGVTLSNGVATIYYSKRHMFFRQLGILVEKCGSDFEHFDDLHFETISVMIDTSRCAVPTVATVCKMLDYLALSGYGMAMLYTEDTVELEGRPYFGYMRGRYTKKELTDIDDYAFDYGIEMIPCLECYGHMDKYLIWPEAADIKDTDSVLLAREEKTFEFLDELIGTVSSCFRSKRIHIGMDEAWDMGRGAFLNKHGYVPPFEIFNEYMERLIKITDKYSLVPMMWSDMYFRVCSKANKYLDKDIEISKEVAEKIPDNVELIFWHYGEKPYCDEYMLEKHRALDRKIIYAGGSWSWIGHFPENNYTMETVKYSLEACRKYNVRESMLTLWFNDNAECDLFANLFAISFFAEMCFDKNADEKKLRSRFETVTGGDYDAFLNMSLYHNDFENNNEYERFHDRFLGKPLFWQDIMEGLYDYNLFAKPMSEHYANCADKMKVSSKRWNELYDFSYKVFDYLSAKTYIAENLVPAYKSNYREMLDKISNVLLPELKEKTRSVHEAHKKLWFDRLKITGWANLDVRYAGVVARCDTAIMLINDYLNGQADTIEELEHERLSKPVRGFIHYSAVSTVNIKI